MELREFMSVRRAYNLVRQETDTSRRLTFEEFAILCRLDIIDEPMKTSAIAEYQGALRPTMTHRTNHLAKLGYIDRVEGLVDRRNIVCTISDEGREEVRRLAELTKAQIIAGQPLSRTTVDRVCKYVDAMGSMYCTAGEMVLLALIETDEVATITTLVDRLGLLQPTVSMSVSTLAENGLVQKESLENVSSRSTCIRLTDEGKAVAQGLVDRIATIIVRRKPRL
ncbi:MAG: winged helix DNA-binding protein [Coriobacteriales bacterium]|nr:winged helix DNA-binding protein [Coriobacteriales bacterium]